MKDLMLEDNLNGLVHIAIKRDTYEDLFRMLDGLKEYKNMSFDDFIDQIIRSGMLLVETSYKHRDI